MITSNQYRHASDRVHYARGSPYRFFFEVSTGGSTATTQSSEEAAFSKSRNKPPIVFGGQKENSRKHAAVALCMDMDSVERKMVHFVAERMEKKRLVSGKLQYSAFALTVMGIFILMTSVSEDRLRSPVESKFERRFARLM